MAAFFGCTVEYLLYEGEGDVSKIPTTTMSEEIIETLERCVGGRGSRGCWGCALERDWECDQHLRELSIYLINRQKEELETLKEERENMQAEIMRFEDMKFTQEHCDLYSENEFLKAGLRDQKAEIERLTEEKSFATRKMMESKAKAVELQKQVDELNDLQFTKEHCNLYKENKWLKECLHKAVKDTAKEIIKWIKLNGLLAYGGYVIHDSMIEQMCKKYGVEVE